MSSLTAPRKVHPRELVVHLARREVSSRHRWTLLGWAWPLTRQLAQLAVLVFVFSAIFDLGIENYTAFVFIGLVFFNWFASAVTEAAGSLIGQRHLVFQPRFPAVVIPAVAVAVPFVDVLMATPVMIGMLAVGGDLSATAPLVVVLVAVQALLMLGLAWLAAAFTVYLRDIPNVVTVGVLLLFYLTPVFYDLSRVPEEYEWLLRANPMTTLIEGYRSVLIDDTIPPVADMVPVTLASLVVAVGGLLVFRRLSDGFVDEL